MPTATHAIEPTTTHSPTHPAAHKLLDSRTLFLLGLLIAGSSIVSPPVALVGGIAFGFTVDHPLRAESARLSKLLLQASVIALGFGMNIQQVAHAGRSGFAYTAISITTAMVLGLALGKLLHIGGKASFLITAGTAICGGSAIAAIAPITNANEEEISVSMGTVFLLNSVALLLFPPIGHLLHLTQNQFGLWAALAIHDTSSVVGAAAAYGTQALAIGTTVKLARALWIVPVSLFTAVYMARVVTQRNYPTTHHRSKVTIPWFILFFCAAAALATYLPSFHHTFAALNHLGKAGLTATLFLIGTSLSKKTLRQVGVRPLVQGIVLWIIVGAASLAAIYFHLIAI
ncbi:YeiH family protein [Granulicella sp. L46]|uniref:YeiH family protein n=1 Tax=Granulicella sp. L46 TaxID=1641865 RepID=UPI00131C80E5|nr:putative sulfate exporter family transporter [Granulicella sp. L46]